MSTTFHMSVEKVHRRPDMLPLETQTLVELKSRLPADAIALESAELPAIVICHRGKALGLHMMRRGAVLTVAETNAVIAARASGMRIEFARGLPQALTFVREMGVALKDDAHHQMRDHYRGAVRRPR